MPGSGRFTWMFWRRCPSAEYEGAAGGGAQALWGSALLRLRADVEDSLNGGDGREDGDECEAARERVAGSRQGAGIAERVRRQDEHRAEEAGAEQSEGQDCQANLARSEADICHAASRGKPEAL